MRCAVIAECCDCIVLSPLPAGARREGRGERSGRGDQEASVRVCLSGGMRCERWRGAPLLVGGGGCQLVGLSAFRLVDLLGSRKVGELAGCGGFLVYRRGKRASAQEEGLLGGRGSGAAGSGTFGRVTADAPLLLVLGGMSWNDTVAAGGYRGRGGARAG